MKKYFYIVFLFLVSCQNTKSTQTTDTNEVVEATPDYWIEYKPTANSKGKRIVLVSGDEEYRSEEALPQLAKILTKHHGFDCTVLFAQNPDKLGLIDPNYGENIPGLEQLQGADLMILFTRFRALPAEQMQYIENYLLAGKPLIAIRTATHAFNYEDDTHPFSHYGWNYKGEKTDWQLGFGKQVLGETWYTHHGHHKHQSTRGVIATNAANHPLVNGIADGSMWGPTDVYGIRMPMQGDAQSIVLGQTIDRAGEYDESDAFYGMKESDTKIATLSGKGEKAYDPNAEMPPIVWTKSYQLPTGKKGKSLTSTIGAATDMVDEEVRRLFVNAVYYLLDKKVPEKAKVEIIGSYKPAPYSFHDDEHWQKKGLKVKDYLVTTKQ